MGVDVIYIYLETERMPKTVPDDIQVFVKSGLVELIDWSIGVEKDDYGQFGVIQDCLYRSKSTVEYLALYDIDEIIVARNQLTWADMITEIEHATNLNNYASLSFEDHVWIDNGSPITVDMETCPNMSMPIYLKRTQRTTSTYIHTPPKVMVRTKFVDSCWIHYALERNHNLLLEYRVPMDIASVHHYRRNEFKFTNSVFDDSMKKYARNSMELIKDVVCK